MESIEPQLQKFIEKTKEGKISWVLINANALRWTQTVPGKGTVTTTLQAQGVVPVGIPNRNYVLTVQSTQPPGVIVQINTATEAKYKPLLNKLFDLASQSSKDSSGKFLDDLLDLV